MKGVNESDGNRDFNKTMSVAITSFEERSFQEKRKQEAVSTNEK